MELITESKVSEEIKRGGSFCQLFSNERHFSVNHRAVSFREGNGFVQLDMNDVQILILIQPPSRK